jgi:hypothetical protein
MSRLRLALLTLVAALCLSAPASAADDLGDFQLEWGSLTSQGNDNGAFKKRNRPAARYLKRSGQMEAVVNEVNTRWSLPRDVLVLFSDEIQEGPAFIPDIELEDGSKLNLINFPGTFLTLEVQQLRKELRGVKGVSAADAMVFANEFVLAHEIGHALVHDLELPITGREEDAVDGFAAYLLADNPKFGPATALTAALFFDAMSSIRGKLHDEDFADEHSILEQRVYQFLCWTYGSDPKEFRSIVGKGGLPRARAARCPEEFNQVKTSWDRLLAPYAKG